MASSSDLLFWEDSGEVTAPPGANEVTYAENLPADTSSIYYRVRRAP